MIFHELVLHNFGIYKGVHRVNLSPLSPEKPIILFGGLNGAGKTSFLDAMKLVLYGKFADCSNRGGLSYADYLNATINRSVDPMEGAQLELEFSLFDAGVESTTRIKRFWNTTSTGTCKEGVEVIRNGLHDPVLSDQWYEHVNELIPQNISSLFFFDGEKIESLADPRTAADIIKTGIYSLLGLNLISRLITDLSVVDSRLAKKAATASPGRITLDEIASAIHDVQQKYNELERRRAKTQTKIDRLQFSLAELDRTFKDSGGEIYLSRSSIEALKSNEEARLSELQLALVRIAEPSPLLMLRRQIEQLASEAKSSKAHVLAESLLPILESRDADFLQFLREQQTSREALEAAKAHLEADRTARIVGAPQICEIAGIDESEFANFDSQSCEDLSVEIIHLTEAIEHITESISALDRKLSMIPAEEAISTIIKDIEEKKHDLIRLQMQSEQLALEMDSLNRQLIGFKQKREKLELQIISENSDSDLFRNMHDRSQLAKRSLLRFEQAILNRNITKLENLIFESFQSLSRKPDLISKLEISTTDFALTIYDKCSQPISTDRLSAGERQLLAISILWGLGKASGRPLPSIVDTPLGRLDSQHRTHLVENYFPNASHQMILLSTDEEIDQTYRETLLPSIGREYHIAYSSELGTSTIETGYF